jgi:hypothetical protein
MILKKLKRTVFTKPKATMIAGLVDYILQTHDAHGDEKLAYSGSRNFFSGTPAGWKAEMIALASESVQSRMPVTHWSLSWQENELPDHEQIDEAVDVFLQRMGLEGHQIIYALHKNTGHYHVHIAVNRTHPETMKVIQPHRGFDIEEAHRIAALLVHKQGWAAEANARYRVEQNGEIVRNQQRKGIVNPASAAEDFESASGEKSAQRIAQERGHAVIKNAQSWTELHEGLRKVGLRFEKKGSGAIVFVGDIAVKASSVDRNFGLSKLCKRLGDFESGDYAPEMKTPESEPLSSVALEEWREHQALRAQEAEKRREQQKRIAAAMLMARAGQRERRRVDLAALTRHGLSILNIARHFLRVQQREELRRQLAELPKPEKPLPCFRAWLVERAPRLRALWRFRRRVTPGMEVWRPEFPKIGNMASPYRAYRELVQKRYPEKMDESRLDAAVALWMRATGYSRPEVANEMYRKARPLRKENRDWIDYARRAAWYAFGVAGDIDIAAAKLTPEKILKFHQEAEQLEAARQAPEREKEAARPMLRMR